jgi:hypothetical protein
MFNIGIIIGLCGVDFVIERAEPYFFPVLRNFGFPSALFFTKMNADLYRGT